MQGYDLAANIINGIIELCKWIKTSKENFHYESGVPHTK